MNTLIVGYSEEVQVVLSKALDKRNHFFMEVEPKEENLQLLTEKNISLILLTDNSEETLNFSRQIRALKNGRRYTIYSIINKNDVGQLYKLLEADVDQYILESLFDEQRLDIRIEFAERQARNKQGQFLIEQKLRDSEARARTILRTTVDAIITIDEQGHIRSFNSAAERLFQYDTSEVIGKNVNILMPQPYKREHDSYISNYHKTGSRKIIGIGREVTGQRKDGSTFPMYLAVSEVKTNDEKLFTGIVRDITEQRRLEQEVLRISEHERLRIGQDLHDGLGQMLTGITLINKHIAATLREEDHPLAGEAEEITKLIKESDEYARNLSRTLIPVELDSNGLTTAIKRLAENAEKLFGIECELNNFVDIHFDDPTCLTHLYRIVQEATSNAVKHGNSTKVVIEMEADSDKLILTIQDDGTGFAEDWDKKKGLGVRIMQFRSNLIGANLQIRKSRLGGAAIIVTLLSVGSSYKVLE
ncbi:MAG: PAS domain S-box protein [Balneolaceae bacterium]